MNDYRVITDGAGGAVNHVRFEFEFQRFSFFFGDLR